MSKEEKIVKETSQEQADARRALQEIKKAEERARQMVEEARTRTAPGLIKQATAEAEEIRKKILAEARQQGEKIKQEIIEKAMAEARSIEQQIEVEKQQIWKSAEAAFARAVENTAVRLLEILKTKKV
ncbi:MAG: hypothetical protein WBI18_10880 [Candidatus Saccharicenans sp.]